MFSCACGALGRSWSAPGRSWDALRALLGRSWGALGRSWDALGALLGKNTKKQRLRPKFRCVFGRGFGRVLTILNVLVKNLRLHRRWHRFFNVFFIVRELLATAQTLNFVAPVDVLWCFSEVDVSRSRRVRTREDLGKNIYFSLQLEAKFLQNQVV